MDHIAELAALLRSKKAGTGYAALTELQRESRESDAVYPYLDEFAAMLEDKSSYVRTRGLILLAENARWDEAGRLDAVMDRYLSHVTDEKPITARQCVQLLPLIAACKPALRERIVRALQGADLSRYGESMAPLVEGDIRAALAEIDAGEGEAEEL